MKKISFLVLTTMLFALVMAPVSLSATTPAEQKVIDCVHMGGTPQTGGGCSFAR